MKKTGKRILLVGFLAMMAMSMVACGDDGESTSSFVPNAGSESSLPGSGSEDSSSGCSSSGSEDSSSGGSSSGGSSSGGSSSGSLDATTSFPATESIYLCHNQTIIRQTEHILIWPAIDGAAGYEISAFGQTFTTTKTHYDFTAYCSVGSSEEFSVKAVDGSGEYLDFEAITVVEQIEAISSGLTYTQQADGTYAVVVTNASSVGGRLVLPDTCVGKEVTKTVSSYIHRESGITSVRFPKYLTEIGELTFINSSLESIVIPEGVKTIGDEAFMDIETLKEVSFPKTLTSIGVGAFQDCGIEELFLPKTIVSLSDSSFASCTKLRKVIFETGSQITEIPLYVFTGCESLSEINIPAGVKKIGERSFYLCDLKEIGLPENLQTIEYGAFSLNKNLTTIHIPKGVTDLQDGAFFTADLNYISFTSFTVAEENLAYKSVDGNIYSKNGTKLVQYAIAKPETEFTVPDGVTEIGAYAFAYAPNLVKVTLPQGIKEIGSNAFYQSTLAEINFPDGLTTLRGNAISHTKLTKVILPDSVTVIEQNAIGGLHLDEFRMPIHLETFGRQSGLTIDVLEIPEGMKLVEKVFASTNIKKLVLTKTFEASEGALFGSWTGTVNLPDIFYMGTEAELSQLIADGLVAENAFSGKEDNIFDDMFDDIFGGGTSEPATVYATIYYYSEEEPALNEDGTAYDGNFWHYDENGEIVVWVKQSQS